MARENYSMEALQFSSVIFNFHDVILLMTSMQCLFCFLLLCLTIDRDKRSTLFLALFLLAHALIPINELVMWGAEFKMTARDLFPSLYFFPMVAYYVDGALLYLCFKALVFKDFSLTKIDLFHFIPLIAYITFIGLVFYSKPQDIRLEMINSESFVYSASYVYMEFLSKLIRVFYAFACFLLISRYSSRLQDTNSNMEKVHLSWLRALVIGFLLVMISEAILVAAKIINIYTNFSFSLFVNIGLTGYYITFALVNLLVFTAVRYFGAFEQISEIKVTKKARDERFVQPELALSVDNAIRGGQIYMDPDITLDKLAETLKILPRDLSSLINRHFGVNFYEFINRYRIEEAKRMLSSEKYRATTITDIYLKVGFNSKSVFYTFFKKLEGMTPSQCRQIG